MKLEEVIAQLPKPLNVLVQEHKIDKAKLDITEQYDRIKKLYQELFDAECNINLSIKANIEQTNKIITKNINRIEIIKNTLDKITELEKSLSDTKNIYNTNWTGGKYDGIIIETDDGYRARFAGQSRSFKYKNTINSDKQIICKNKEDCKIQAEKYLYEYYDGLGRITNKYRFIRPDIIEVQLAQNKTFITNSKFLDLINKHTIGLKSDKKNDKYYVYWVESPKVNKPLTELITKLSKPKFANGCEFDFREENLIESDNKVIGEKYIEKINQNQVQAQVQNQIQNQIQNQVQNQVVKQTNKDGLPLNEWIKGKYAGTIFTRTGQNKWSVVVKKTDGSVATKTLSFTPETKDKVYEEAIQIRNNLSDMYDLTTNKIRILNDDKIEVMLSKDQTMITDYKFLSVVEKYPIFASKSDKLNAKYYASMMIGNEQKQFHNFITGFDMVDHIDRNPLNNCLDNLRAANHKENNNNRNKSESSNAIELGVTYCAKDNCYRARIKQDDKEYSKQFSVAKYGKDNALQMAIEARKEFNVAFGCTNG